MGELVPVKATSNALILASSGLPQDQPFEERMKAVSQLIMQ